MEKNNESEFAFFFLNFTPFGNPVHLKGLG